MRLMAVSQCRPGDVVADVIWSREGTVLADRKEALTEGVIQRMVETGPDVVPIAWPGWEGVRPYWWLPDSLIAPLRSWAERGLSALDAPGLAQARYLALQLIDQFPIGERRPFEWIPLYHGGNPALVAWVNTIGLTIKLTQAVDWHWVEDYALAAVLVGLEMQIADRSVSSPSHARMAELTSRVRPLSALAATTRAAIAQHHARWDGSGEPPHQGEKIYAGARILGLAEFINSLLYCTDEAPLPVNEALEWVVGGAGIDFPLELIRTLQRTAAPYPVGTVVQLGNGEVGVVLENPHDWPSRPQIRILNGKYSGREFKLKDPDQHVRVITGFYNGRDVPS
jgi:hypothetical protein